MIYKLTALLLVAGFLAGASELQVPHIEANAEERAELEAGTLLPDLEKLEALRMAHPPRAEFIQALVDIRTGYRETLATLQARFTEASDEAQARELQQAIHDLKIQTEISIIEAQIALALHDGRDEDARKMDLILQGSKKFLSTTDE